ncbi:unnamed protein product [Brassica napus]|uniref:(rape) hypothetical protein n=1 Tax=Brassica napus TaxID=3708 RepID=A0A816KLQ0_BRANA|nr:unnamed protein product [Brassica napus]
MDLGGWFPDLPLGSLCRAVATSGSGGPPWCLGGSVTNGWSGVETPDFLPMVVSAVIACRPFPFRECVR